MPSVPAPRSMLMSPTDCSSPTVLQKASGWPGACDTEVSRSNHHAAASEPPTATTTSRIHTHPGTGLRRRPSSTGEVGFGFGSAMAPSPVASEPSRPGVLDRPVGGTYPMGYDCHGGPTPSAPGTGRHRRRDDEPRVGRPRLAGAARDGLVLVGRGPGRRCRGLRGHRGPDRDRAEPGVRAAPWRPTGGTSPCSPPRRCWSAWSGRRAPPRRGPPTTAPTPRS